MTFSRPTLALVFTLGVAAGVLFARIASPAPAAAAQSPAPTQTMGGYMGQMMPPPRSAADRGYMGAMLQMHGSMMRATMTGNADHDFLVMMIPHHEAAVAMAQTELQYGSDANVKGLAKTIMTSQQAEIRKMRAWLK